VAKYELIVQLAGDFFASMAELQAFETRLISYLPRTHHLTKRELHTSAVNFHLDTDFPVAAYKLVRRISIQATQRRMRIAYRAITGKTFTNLWPRRDPRAFALAYTDDNDPFAPASKRKLPKRSPRGTRAI
jgi:hypothetical protein